MKWFRHKLRKNRIFILTLLALNLFYMVDGRQFVYAHQLHEQKEERLKEISELLDIPVEKLRPDHETLFESLQEVLGIEPEDSVKAAGLKRLQEVLKEHEDQLAANPYLPQIDEIKREHAAYRIEGVLNDLKQLTQPRGGKALPEASQRALLRNLHHALQQDLTLPVSAGLPAKARAKLAAFQTELDRLFESVRSIVGSTGDMEIQQLDSKSVLAQKLDQLKLIQGAEVQQPIPEPRFTDRPLPLRRMEKKARTENVTSETTTKWASPAFTQEKIAPRVPIKNGLDPEIVDLAASLGNSPARIFRFVHDTIELDAKWGAFRSPLGTLWEGRGASWDQAWLLRDLLTAAGIDALLEWGEIEISTDLLTNITGLDDPFRAGDLLTTAGVPIVLLVQGSQVIGARMSHVWVKAFVDYIPNRGVTTGPGDTWIRMDPSLQRRDYAAGIPIHEQVPFALGDYLQSGTVLSPRRAYEEALWDYIRANNIDCTNLDQLKRAGVAVRENFPFIPGTMRGKLLGVEGESAAVPDAFQQQIQLQVRKAGGPSLLTWSSVWPALYGRRVEIAYAGATGDDQAVLDAHGGIFNTPPQLVDLKPVIRIAGVEVASGAAIGSAEDIEVFVTLTPPNAAPAVVSHNGSAGERSVLALDFGRVPQQMIDAHQEAINAARAVGDGEAEEAETLFLLGAQYLQNLSRDLEDLSGWKWHRLVKLGTEGLITQSGNVTTTVGGTPIAFNQAEKFVDIATMPLGIFPADGNEGFIKETFELLGSQGSFLEGEVFNQVLQHRGIAAVSALTLTQRLGQMLTRVDSANLSQVLAAVDLGDDVEQEVAFAVNQGKIAWVGESRITTGQWTGTGYVLEDPATGAAGYLISGSLAGGADTEELLERLEEIFGDEPWMSDSGLSDFLLGLLSFFGVPGADDGPGTNQSDPVNLSTGNFWLTEEDLSVMARGFPIFQVRTYNSRSTYNGPLGFGWTFTYGEHLEQQPDGSALYREGDGTEHLFTLDGSGGYVRPPGKHLALTQDSGGFTLGTKQGQSSRFALDGRLLSIADRNGNTVTLGYDGSGNLSTVTDAAGRAALTVTTAGGKITEVTALGGQALQYTYNGDDLVAVNDISGQTWTYDYDASHNLIARGDPLGNLDSYLYDSLDRVISHVDPLGSAETFAYSSRGESAVLTDQRGFSNFFEFDATGRAVLAADPLGNARRSTWDADNNRTSTTDPRGGVTSRTFDDRGNMLTETDPAHNVTTITYDPVFNNILTTTDARGHTATRAYDGAGNLLSVTQEVAGLPVVESFTYDSLGQLLEIRDANDNPDTFTWDSTKGVIVGRTDSFDQTTTYTVDDLGRVLEIEDPDNNVVTVTWDDGNRISTLTDAFGNTTTIRYDAAGRRSEVENARGTSTTEFDAKGRPVSLTDALGNAVAVEYDPVGNLTRRLDALGNQTSMTYDAVGRVAGMVDRLGNVWGYGYCSQLGTNLANTQPCTSGNCSGPVGSSSGSFCSITDPLGNTTEQSHDALGRVSQVTDPLGNTTDLEYDELGRLTAVTDALDRTTRYAFDELGRLLSVEEANGELSEYTYDDFGNLTNVKDAEGRDWPRAYDAMNRLATESDPLGNTTARTYDALGNLLTDLNPNGDMVTFGYDANRVVSITLPGGVQETFGYDQLGRVTAMANAEVSINTEYDSLDRLVRTTNSTLGQTVENEYDANGNRISMTGPLGKVEFFYDAENRLVEQRDPATGTYRFEYDPLGRRTKVVYPNGLESSYPHDAAGRLESLITRNRLGEVVDGYSYAYDAAGNRLTESMLHQPVTSTYEYDEVDRLTRWQRGSDRFEAYTYDGVGNRLSLEDQGGSTQYSYDAANRLLDTLRQPASGVPVATTYGWDDSGNLISKDVGGLTTGYQYDALSRLTGTSGPEGIFAYGYDPLGIRVRETRDGQTTRLLHAFEDIVGVYDGANNLETYFSHGPDADDVLALAGSHGTRYLHRDGVGSVTAASNGQGAVAAAATYAAFGGVESAIGTLGRYGFAGRELDPTGLMYNRARYYQPELGRFTTQDLIEGVGEVPGTSHDYVYALNNPAKFVDPDGLAAQLLALPLIYLFGAALGMALMYFALLVIAFIIAWVLVYIILLIYHLIVIAIEYPGILESRRRGADPPLIPSNKPWPPVPLVPSNPDDPCDVFIDLAKKYSWSQPQKMGYILTYIWCKVFNDIWGGPSA